MLEFPKSIKDGDIELIKLDPTFENARRIFDIIDQDREFLRVWLPWVDGTHCPEDVYPHMKDVCSDTYPGFYILYKGEIVGCVDFVDVSERHHSGEIGYWLTSKFNGFGIMTRSVKMLENLAFKDYNFNRIEIRVSPKNIPSQNVIKRCGYVQEGVARSSYFLRDEPSDTIVFSKLKSEWIKENKNA